MTTPPISRSRRAGPVGRIAVGLFFSVFLAVGAGFTWAFTAKPVAGIVAAQSWERTSCVILSSRVENHSSSDGSSFKVAVSYRYLAAGREHHGNRYKFTTGSSSGYNGKAAIVAGLQPGTSVDCWFDPAHPGDSVIERGFTADIWFGAIPLLFALIGAVGIISVIRGKGRASAVWNAPATSAIAAWTPASAGKETTTLRPSTGRATKAIVMTLAAIFWNGFISLFVTTLVRSSNHPGLFSLAGLFMLPFVIVGLVLIAIAIRLALELFNPRATIAVSAPAVALGDELTVDWTITGRVDKLTQFTVELIGSEQATYRRGTSSRTDHQVFARISVAAKGVGEIQRTGFARVTVPPGSMHTLNARNNKVVWVLRVRGEVPRWPDATDDFSITVAPRR